MPRPYPCEKCTGPERWTHSTISHDAQLPPWLVETDDGYTIKDRD